MIFRGQRYYYYLDYASFSAKKHKKRLHPLKMSPYRISVMLRLKQY